MRPINLTKLLRDAQASAAVSADDYSSTDDVGENPGTAAPVAAPAQTTPVVINADCIRCFTARRDNRPGTRITFNDGGGFVVTEDFQTVQSMVALH